MSKGQLCVPSFTHDAIVWAGLTPFVNVEIMIRFGVVSPTSTATAVNVPVKGDFIDNPAPVVETD